MANAIYNSFSRFCCGGIRGKLARAIEGRHCSTRYSIAGVVVVVTQNIDGASNTVTVW
jgi:hypothetical protein